MKQKKMNRHLGQRTDRIERLTLSAGAPDTPWMADATPFFGRCSDELLSLHFGGRAGILDLFNWVVSDTFLETFDYITYVRRDG